MKANLSFLLENKNKIKPNRPSFGLPNF